MGFAGVLEQLARLGLAVLAGGAIGLEREWREKAAGFRTITLVAAGSALFSMAAGAGFSPTDRARIAAGIVTGIGFLGAGAILRDSGEVLGLTTAAAVWVAAALGMAAGFGAYAITVAGVFAALVVLLIFPRLDEFVSRVSKDERVYEVVARYDEQRWPTLEAWMREHGLSVHGRSVGRQGDSMVIVVATRGRPEAQREVTRLLLSDETLEQVTVRP